MRRLLPVLLVVLLIFCGVGLWYRSYLVTPSQGSGEVIVVIPKGSGVRGIGTLLAAQGLLKNDIRYLALVRLTGIRSRLQAGEYSLPRGLTPPELLQLLVKGSTLRHHVTIPEGVTVDQVATLFERDGWIKRDRFLALAQDGVFIRQLGLDTPGLEGYLFPETYTLVRNTVDEQAVLRMMVDRFQHVWRDLNITGVHGLNRDQIVILASIVEKETGVATERPLIARVFLNRLQRGMRLQSDPTVIYGLHDFNGNLTKADLKRQTPYNTYTLPALPAGPICNPGRAALEAVVHPVDSEALYFVSKNDGTHIFSTNLVDHNRAVQVYQRGQ